MFKTARLTAEEQFAATQKKDKRVLKEKEKARQEIAEHVASLRALRLAKEAAAEKAAAKNKNTSQLPQGRLRHDRGEAGNSESN